MRRRQHLEIFFFFENCQIFVTYLFKNRADNRTPLITPTVSRIYAFCGIFRVFEIIFQFSIAQQTVCVVVMRIRKNAHDARVVPAPTGSSGLKSREQRPVPIKNTHAVSSQYNKPIAVYLFSMATPATPRLVPSIHRSPFHFRPRSSLSVTLSVTAFTLKACTRYIEGHYVKGNRCIK